MPVSLTDYADLGSQEKGRWEAILGPLTSLQRALDWGRTQEPPVAIDEILTQDEYTHDVIMAVNGGRYLVFDTT
jgi:hypothetical protein